MDQIKTFYATSFEELDNKVNDLLREKEAEIVSVLSSCPMMVQVTAEGRTELKNVIVMTILYCENSMKPTTSTQIG